GVPRILPLVWHRNDVSIVKIGPIVIPSLSAALRRRRAGRIPFQPGSDVKVVELLGPEQPCKRLPLYLLGVFRETRRRPPGVKLFCLSLAAGQHTLKTLAEQFDFWSR